MLVSDVGTRLVVAGAGDQSAAQRATAVARRLNAAAARVAAGASLEVRDLESAPVIALTGEAEPLLAITEEDARAYNESWARPSRGAGPPVTRERLARWLGAVLADLAVVLARGEGPSQTPPLAAREGRTLEELHQAAGGTAPRDLLTRRAALREGLRSLALRVPASVPGAAGAPAPAAAATATGQEPPPGGFELQGIWVGSTREAGRRRQFSVTFQGSGGSLTYMGGVDLSQPLVSSSRTGAEVRFSIQRGGGEVHYLGTWDGQRLSGAISSAATGGGDVGTFELYPR
jgi:hypothetical protein